MPWVTPVTFATFLKNNRLLFPKETAKLILKLGTNIPTNTSGEIGNALKQTGSNWPGLVHFLYMGQYLNWVDLSVILKQTNVSSVVTKLTHFDPADHDEIAARIIQVLVDFSPDRSLASISDETARAIVGGKFLSEEDIMNALGYGTKFIEDVVRGSVPPGQVAGYLDQLYQIEGISSYFATVVQRSGYQWGSDQEIHSLLSELMDGVSPSNLRLSPPMPDGNLGTDAAKYVTVTIDDVAQTAVDLAEAKALKDVGTLFASRGTNELYSKLLSELRRYGNPRLKLSTGVYQEMPGWMWKAAGQAERLLSAASEMLSLSGTYVFDISFKHIAQNVPDALHKAQNMLIRHGVLSEVDDTLDLDEALVMLGGSLGEQLTDALGALKSIGNINADSYHVLLDHMSSVLRELDDDAVEFVYDGVNVVSGGVTINSATLVTNARTLNLITGDEWSRIIAALPTDDEILAMDVAIFELNRAFAGLSHAAAEAMPDFDIYLRVI